VQRLLQDHRIVGPILARHAPSRLLLYMPFNDCGSGIRRITFPRYELESCASGVFTFRRVR
jgi:hypothetical protein